jgi:hypothetical protein
LGRPRELFQVEGGKKKKRKVGGPRRARPLGLTWPKRPCSPTIGRTTWGRRSPSPCTHADGRKRESGGRELTNRGQRSPAAVGGGADAGHGGPGARPAAFSSSRAASPGGVGSRQPSSGEVGGGSRGTWAAKMGRLGRGEMGETEEIERERRVRRWRP